MKRVLIVRHAARPDISPNTVGNDVMLTDEGIEQSKLFASLISGQVLSIRTSPIGRCVQTAELIAQATHFKPNDIQQCRLLGDPGFIIKDGDLAWQHWLKKGHKAVNLHLLSGTESWDGFYDLNNSAARIFSDIKALLNNSADGVHIWVTHDTILATLAARIGDKRLTLQDWPDFLGYLEIKLSDEQIYVSYSQKPNLVGDVI
ncbi:histidine phosphatase family protein [Pseudoalteromonas lipolytica]|uniref:Broad specificity phosphatase PhoE n=1 Tax=Pseudoalteromonas lipolytica TaxID=570156 RepID=A0ABY1GVR1_9GAMM|nr:histidine phosphatase family protein [Pseudoalteromonas lipolytica]SFU00684.1 Broad specificity phosphatase PhoE [Pseudoalteromonas lipolytica]